MPLIIAGGMVKVVLSICVLCGIETTTQNYKILYLISDAPYYFLPFFIANCGGISEGKKICNMARIYDVLVQTHVCGGPISSAAALQIEAVIPNFCIHEYHVGNMSDFTRSLGIYDQSPVNGSIPIPDGPGLGQEIPEEIIRKCEILTVNQTSSNIFSRTGAAARRYIASRPPLAFYFCRPLCTTAAGT